MTAYELADLLSWVLLAALLVTAGGALGLWYGERGRRQMLERWLTAGIPGTAKTGVAPGAEEPESRIAQLGYSEKTLKTAIKNLQAEGKRSGQPLSPEQAREMAIQMLNPEFNPDSVNPEILPL